MSQEQIKKNISDYFTPQEAAKIAGVSVPTMWRYIESGVVEVWWTAGESRVLIKRNALKKLKRPKAGRPAMEASR